MRLRRTNRDIIALLIILFGLLFVLVQFEIVFRPSSLSGSVHQLGAKLGLTQNRPKNAAYEGEIASGSIKHGWENQTFSTRVRWETGGAPKTAIVAHAPGMSHCFVFLTGPP
jgi:hypothetical protein